MLTALSGLKNILIVLLTVVDRALTGDRDSHAENLAALESALAKLRGQLTALEGSYSDLVAHSKTCCINDADLTSTIRSNVDAMIVEVSCGYRTLVSHVTSHMEVRFQYSTLESLVTSVCAKSLFFYGKFVVHTVLWHFT